ncbi:MAG: FIST C-terminal domain-containing protein [Myxococcales bacterium]|nr:FIST C-terminal domain-containing protein [Myxococcales bacterium]
MLSNPGLMMLLYSPPMIRAGVGLESLVSSRGRTRGGAAGTPAASGRAAVERACERALERSGGADSAILFATPGADLGIGEILDVAISALGTDVVVGATAHGVMGGGQEIEGEPAIAVLAQTGIEARPFLISGLQSDDTGTGEEIAAHIDGPPRDGDLVILLPDPRVLQPSPLLAGIREALGPACVVGAGAGDPFADEPLQWCGRRVESGALAGVVLRATKPAQVGVTQACRPVTELLTATRTQGNWVLELDGRPALDVYREVARAPLAEDLRRAAAFLLVALPRREADPLQPGGYLVRNVAGFDTERRAFAIPEIVRNGRQIALATREPEAARDDLKAMLAGVSNGVSALGLYFNCCARGAGFFGVPGLEAAYLENALGDTPVLGMFGSCEIGPIGAASVASETELLTYTGVLALLED